MPSEKYQVFYEVARQGSISKAAKGLFVSQPAVSKAIKKLEEELGVPLFLRHAKGVYLTKEGTLLFDHVKEAMAQIEEGKKKIQAIKNYELGSIRIGISNILCKYYFIPKLEVFHQAFPGIKINIINRTSPETIELLKEGKVDCAILSEPGDAIKESQMAEFFPLMTIQDCFVSHRPMPQGRETIPLIELEKYPMLMLESNNASRQYLDQFLLSHQVDIQPEIEISNMEFLVEFSKIGLGLATVIQDFVQAELDQELLYQWKTEPGIPKRQIGLFINKKAGASLALERFYSFLLKAGGY